MRFTRLSVLFLLLALGGGAFAQTFSNTIPIRVPGIGSGPGPASPYPSSILVAGMTRPIAKITVTLHNLSHSYPSDIDLLLVGPQGQTVLLMSDCGFNLSVNGVTLVFADGAPPLPEATQITSGTYRPTNFGTAPDVFAAPAPAGPYGATLSVFTGTNANGVWNLYKMDDEGQDTGNKSGGWSLTITPESTITYQGLLRLGASLVNGPADFQFTLFGQPSGGAALTTISRNNVAVSQGLFTVELPGETEFISQPELWLEIAARAPAGSGAFTTLSPRQRISSAPHAIRSLDANAAASAPWSGLNGVPAGFADGIDDGGDGHSLDAADGSPADALFVNAAGRVGIGTLLPEALLHVADGSAGPVTPSSSSSAIFERQANNYVSILSPDANERGILFGSPAEATHGGILYTNAAGLSLRTGGNTTRMVVSPTGDVGIGATPGGARLRVQGAGNSGDILITPTTSGGNSGVVLTETVAGAFGMLMRHNGATNLLEFVGIQNSLENVNPAMTISRATTGGVAVTSNLVVGGNLSVSGTVSKGGGTFRIDHPLDPANRYLSHSFVESPEMKNIYDGSITTDERGYATIEMPAWFEPLNKDFRYQLTVVDESDTDAFILAKVVSPMKEGRFTIRTSQPRTHICWQVTGVRHDAWARANPLQVEIDKPEDERGHYLHPQAFGLPAEQGIGRATVNAR
jgi:hypothetical protein